MRQLFRLLSCAALSAACAGQPGGNPGGTDAPPLQADAIMHTTTNVVCDKTETRTITNAGGTKQQIVTKYGLFAVDPTSYFSVEQCDPTGVYAFTCASGATCTTTGDAITAPCLWSSSGTFTGGKLAIICNTTSTGFDASGTVTSNTSYGYATIRLHN